MIRDLILRSRSYRRFYEDVSVDIETLRGFIELASNSPSAANLQPIKYILSCTPQKNELIFETLAWAGYLRDWDGPEKGERPSAYIVLLGDTSISREFKFDAGIAVQTILLAATEKDFGGCIFGSIQRDRLAKNLNITERFEILLVVGLGKPKEKVVLETAADDGDIRYWRDPDKTHHVPKRRLIDIIF